MDGLRVGLVVSVLALGGCGVSHTEPFVCDPDRAGEIAFGYHHGGAYFPTPGTEANGIDYLFIDGACRYWAPGPTPDQVVTGVLDDELLEEIDAELLSADWASIDGEHVTGCCDGATIALARGEIRASAYETGTSPSSTFVAIRSTAARWAERLGALGEPVAAESPVRLEASAVVEADPAAVTWPLDAALTEMTEPSGSFAVRVTLFEGADADALRTAAGADAVVTFTDGETSIRARVVDVLPLADENGCTQPYFSSQCRVQYLPGS